MEQKKKSRRLKILNFTAILVIVVLVFHHRDRFFAMIHPKSSDLVRDIAPELADGRWINSEPLTLSKLRGKVVVLDFWTYECANCRHVLPTLNDWSQKYRDRGVIVIGVHTPETKEEENFSLLQEFVKQWKISYPILTDNSYTTWNRYKVQFWPTTFLIDKNGSIHEFHIGEMGYFSLETVLQGLLDE